MVDINHVANVLAAGEFVVVAGQYAAVVEQRIKTLLDDSVNERTLPRPRCAGDANELLQRNLDADVPEIVLTGAAHDNRFAADGAAPAGDTDAPLAAEILASERVIVS